jgi:hypothetical protein
MYGWRAQTASVVVFAALIPTALRSAVPRMPWCARTANPYGWETVFDVFDADHAWLLASGAGLWRTTEYPGPRRVGAERWQRAL